jgi:hypothetical protein
MAFASNGVNTTTYTAKITILTPFYYFEFRYIVVNADVPYDFIIIDSFYLINLNPTTGTALTVDGSLMTLSSPLSNYKVIFYLTCFIYDGDNAPVVNVTGEVTSSTTVTITFSATQDSIEFLHGTVIIFDYVGIKNSGIYSLTYGTFLFNSTEGGEIPIPQ